MKGRMFVNAMGSLKRISKRIATWCHGKLLTCWTVSLFSKASLAALGKRGCMVRSVSEVDA